MLNFVSEWRKLSDRLPAYGGATFTRWGKTACPKSTKLIYNGQMASPDLTAAGGGANYLCLGSDPSYHQDSPTKHASSYIGRVWYQVIRDHDTVNPLTYHSVPCTVCEANQRITKRMIPAQTRCPTSDWTLEYSGFLMTSATHGDPSGKSTTHYYRTSYVCVDTDFESFASKPNSGWHGSPLYLVQAECQRPGTLGSCPPYTAKKALACAVCTK